MNKDLKIYAISGKAQHGKDTFAEFLYQELTEKGYKVLVTHYGDLVKYICKIKKKKGINNYSFLI